jgi:hypothetical protein
MNTEYSESKSSTPKRSLIKSIFWRIIGAFQITVGLFCFGICYGRITRPNSSLFPEINILYFTIGTILLLPLGKATYNLGKKFAALPPEKLRDARPPILYLRSFMDDPMAARIPEKSEANTFLPSLSLTTEEEVVANILKRVGPCIAIGRPGENLSSLGFSRRYLSNDEWQDVVLESMRKARLVIMRAGNTKGFWWEVKRAREYVEPQLLIFLIPFESQNTLSLIPKSDSYEIFRQEAQEYLGFKLPLFHGTRVFGSSLAGILYFNRNWTPHIVALDQLQGRTLEKRLTQAFDPILRQIHFRRWSSL